MLLSNAFFYSNAPKRYGWFHLVVNFISPLEGFKIYNDGIEVGSDIIHFEHSYGVGDGRILIGRSFSGVDGNYASVEVDELLFFNEALTEPEIIQLKQQIN